MAKSTINLVTSNKNKVEEFQKVLSPEIELTHIALEYPELRADEPEEVSMLAAKQLCEMLKKDIVVEDSGFFVSSLGNFPGTCTAYSHKRIGNKGILKLMEGEKNRKCFYKSAIGLCSPGKKPIVFSGIEEGTVAYQEEGNFGWGQDSIFIPIGKKLTYGVLKKDKQKYSVNIFRKKALLKLKEHILMNVEN